MFFIILLCYFSNLHIYACFTTQYLLHVYVGNVFSHIGKLKFVTQHRRNSMVLFRICLLRQKSTALAS